MFDRKRLHDIGCSLPLLSPIVRIDDVPYLDGGIVNSVPIQYAQSIGNEKVIVIMTRNQGYRKGKQSKRMKRLFSRSYKRYPELVRSLNSRYERYNKNMDYLEELERAGRVYVIRPQVALCGRMERNPEKLASLYDHGYNQMENEYDGLLDYLDRK